MGGGVGVCGCLRGAGDIVVLEMEQVFFLI